MTVLSASEIAAYAKGAGFTGPDIQIATAVALAESSGRTDATNHNRNGSTDYGLWQINSIHAALLASGDWSNPADNARMAKAVKDGSGWGAWATFNSGAHLQFMGQASGADPNVPVTAGSTLQLQGVNNSGVDSLNKFLSDHSTWTRAAYFVAGGLCLLIALKLLAERTGVTKAVTKTVEKVAVAVA